MDSDTFRFIERQLYNYDETKRRIEELRDTLTCDASPAVREMVPGAGYISDPTANKAIRAVMSSPVLYRMETNIRSIDASLRRLTDGHRKVFYLKYQLDLSVPAVCMRMPCSTSGFYKLRRQLVEMAAEEMGFKEVTSQK